MQVITPKAFALMVRCKGDNEMVYVHASDSLGFPFEGRVLGVNGLTYDAEAVNGDTIYNCRVDRIMSLDLRPFTRFARHTESTV